MAAGGVQNALIPGLPTWPGLKLEISETDIVIREADVIDNTAEERDNMTGIVTVTTRRGAVTRIIRRDPTGHYFSYQFEVLNHHRGEDGAACFQASCELPCDFPGRTPPLTTSWLCQMIFGRVDDNYSTCIIFKLTRTDTAANIPVDVGINLIIQNEATQLLFNRASMIRNDVRSGQQIDGHLIKNFQIPEQAGYYRRKLFVKIEVSVLCHDNRFSVQKRWDSYACYHRYFGSRQ